MTAKVFDVAKKLLCGVVIFLVLSAQAPVKLQIPTTNTQNGTATTSTIDVTATNPLPVTQSGSAGLSHAQTAALASNLQVTSNALFGFEVGADSTLAASPWWILVFNSASVPADGAVTPDKCYQMSSGEIRFTANWPTPVIFSSGIVVVASSSGCFTKTASTHAFIGVDYK